MHSSQSIPICDETRQLVLLVQYDPSGGLPAHVRIHLERLRTIATKLVLISNSPLSQDARRTAGTLCDGLIVRDNIGWDFAGWRDALAVEGMAQWDSVVLTNSSIVGPLYPLAPIFRDMAARGHDFWGMVHSCLIRSHLQSYFLVFTRRVILSDAWRDFWHSVEDATDKRTVIRKYEVGLSQTLIRSGFSPGSFMEDPHFPRSIRLVHIKMLGPRIRIPLSVNYIHKSVELHDELIRQGMPYLKASLLWGKDVYRCKPMEIIKSIPGVDYPWSEIGF